MNNYYLTNRFKYFFIGFSMLQIIIFISLFLYITPIRCIQVYVLAIGLFGIYTTLKKIQNEHLVVSEKGVEYYSPWLILESKWESIEKISYYWHNGLRVESLLIDNSQIRVKKWSFPDRGPLTPLEGFPRKTIIPLSCYADNWRNSELGQQIKQNAPHLFQ